MMADTRPDWQDILENCATELSNSSVALAEIQSAITDQWQRDKAVDTAPFQRLDELTQLISTIGEVMKKYNKGETDLQDIRPENLRDRLLGTEETTDAGEIQLF